MKDNNVNVSFSLGFIGIVVGIVLCILQAVGTINIGWFWATFPFWIGFAVELVLLVIVGIICYILNRP